VTYLITGTPELVSVVSGLSDDAVPGGEDALLQIRRRPMRSGASGTSVDFAFAPEHAVAEMRPPGSTSCST
jgi:hypothetical protein